jgi:hypothetical protein
MSAYKKTLKIKNQDESAIKHLKSMFTKDLSSDSDASQQEE